MNRKGQALVEFVLILPILILLLLAIVDFGNILYNKNKLENISSDIVQQVKNGDDVTKIQSIYKNIELTTTSYQEEYQKISIQEKVNVLTPFLDKIIGNPYIISVERVIKNVE